MCPSFSLCACRILKMRSCLAESAGAGQLQGSGDLGQLGNIFFFELQQWSYLPTWMIFFGRDCLFLSRGWIAFGRRAGTRRSALSSSPLCFGKVFGFAQDVMTFRIGDLVKIPDSWFPECGCSLYEFARCLRGQLAKHIPRSAKYVERQIHDQGILSFVLLH